MSITKDNQGGACKAAERSMWNMRGAKAGAGRVIGRAGPITGTEIANQDGGAGGHGKRAGGRGHSRGHKQMHPAGAAGAPHRVR